jgi:DNA-binding IclR family transcriptional regulator
LKKTSSLQKGLEILHAFTQSKEELTVQMISKKLNIPLSTTYRYIDALLDGGFLSRNSIHRKLEIGPVLFHIAYKIVNDIKILDIVKPQLESLQERSGETVVFHILKNFQAMCVARAEPPVAQSIRFGTQVGETLPLHVGASAKVLLAFQRNSFLNLYLRNNELTRFTSNTITDPTLLKEKLRSIRNSGIAYSNQEVSRVTGAIAAPLLIDKKKAVASISIVGHIDIFQKRRNLNSLTQMLKDTVRAVSMDLGYSRWASEIHNDGITSSS